MKSLRTTSGRSLFWIRDDPDRRYLTEFPTWGRYSRRADYDREFSTVRIWPEDNIGPYEITFKVKSEADALMLICGRFWELGDPRWCVDPMVLMTVIL